MALSIVLKPESSRFLEIYFNPTEAGESALFCISSRETYSPTIASRYNVLMRYRLRSMMIVAILAPPLLAGLWSLGASAIARMRSRDDDQWEDVGGPGSIAEFSTHIECYLGEDENEATPESAP